MYQELCRLARNRDGGHEKDYAPQSLFPICRILRYNAVMFVSSLGYLHTAGAMQSLVERQCSLTTKQALLATSRVLVFYVFLSRTPPKNKQETTTATGTAPTGHKAACWGTLKKPLPSGKLPSLQLLYISICALTAVIPCLYVLEISIYVGQ